MTKVAEERTALRAMSKDELEAELLSLRKQQFMLRLKRRTEGNLDTPHEFTKARKKIARIKTLMTEMTENKGGADVN